MRRTLNDSISSPEVLLTLPPCTLRCGLIPKRSPLSPTDAMAIQIYLVNANAHATQHLAANFHERETSPLAEAVMTQRLPTHAIYDGALPPLKRRKTAPTRNTDTVLPSSEQISGPLAMLDDSNPPTGDATDSDLEPTHVFRGRHPHMFPRLLAPTDLLIHSPFR